MRSLRNRATAALALAALLAFVGSAGCGDGGSDGPTATPEATATPADRALLLEAREVPPGLAEGVRLGRADAPLQIEMFADFGCPHCLEFTVTIEPRLLEEYIVPGRAALIYRFMPLRDLTAGPAIAAWCAAQQNRFWEYHNLLFAAQARANTGGRPYLTESFVYEGLVAMAEPAGLDRAAFEACLATLDGPEAVLADLERAAELGINGTPTFVINGTVYENPLSWGQWTEILERELKR